MISRHVKTPRAASDTANLQMMDSLEVWAASLKANQLVAVRAHESERSWEGAYWLAVVKGKAFQATEDTLHATDHIEKGFLVVKAQWLILKERNGEGGRRSYTMLDEEVLVVVNTMVRLGGLKFDHAKGGPAERTLRTPPVKGVREKLYYISMETHHSLLACTE